MHTGLHRRQRLACHIARREGGILPKSMFQKPRLDFRCLEDVMTPAD